MRLPTGGAVHGQRPRHHRQRAPPSEQHPPHALGPHTSAGGRGFTASCGFSEACFSCAACAACLSLPCSTLTAKPKPPSPCRSWRAWRALTARRGPAARPTPRPRRRHPTARCSPPSSPPPPPATRSPASPPQPALPPPPPPPHPHPWACRWRRWATRAWAEVLGGGRRPWPETRRRAAPRPPPARRRLPLRDRRPSRSVLPALPFNIRKQARASFPVR